MAGNHLSPMGIFSGARIKKAKISSFIWIINNRLSFKYQMISIINNLRNDKGTADTDVA